MEPCSLYVTKAHAVTGIYFQSGDTERTGTVWLVPSMFVPQMNHSCFSKIGVLFLICIHVVPAYNFFSLNYSAYFLI